jgi:hypothetical protein
MKAKLVLALLAMVAAVITLLGLHSWSAQAQPVASVALPAPGAAKQLYPGCNNISLTFPDGTASQTVVQAVTPAGAVESMWRHNAVQNRFEGFSPQYPQVSDLLTVNFLDAVWFCMTTGALPGGMPPATATPTVMPPGGGQPPQPPPPGVTADVAPTDLYPDNQPQGTVWVRVTNNGPDTLTNKKIDLTVVETRSTLTTPPTAHSSQGPATEYTLNLAPGQSQDINLGAQIDLSQYGYQYTVTVAAKDFTDPDAGNDSYTEAFAATPPLPPGGGSWGATPVDLAVTDLFIKPDTKVFARITNNGPSNFQNVGLLFGCSMERHVLTTGVMDASQSNAPGPITVNLNVGQTQEFDTGFQSFDTSKWWYKVTCVLQITYNDTFPANNTYFEYFPSP